MGTLIDDLIAQVLERVDVETLQITRISKGFRFIGAMLEEGSCGLCFSGINQDPLDSCEYIQSVESLEGIGLIKNFRNLKYLDRGLERIIGISVLNAVSQHILMSEMNDYQVRFDTNPIDHIDFQATDRVVMIGAIGSFLQKIQRLVDNLVVIDDKLSCASYPDIKSPETAQENLNQADIVFITGSALGNNTLEGLLNKIKIAREIVVVGPSAGFLPEPLFDRGVTILSGMQVMDPNKVLQIISEDGGTPHFKKYCKKYNIIRP